jgi:AcrR family transcriptional regulator
MDTTDARPPPAARQPNQAHQADHADQPATTALGDLIERNRFPEGYRRVFLAAAEAFADRGFHGTTTRDIAARAGMSPAVLYVHFRTKEDVLYQVTDAALDLTVKIIETAARSAASPTDRLRAVVATLTVWNACHHAVARVVLYQSDALTPEHYAEVNGKQRLISRMVRQILTDGVSTGHFDIADTTATATAVLSLCLDVVRWYRPGQRRSPEEIGELNARAALRLVAARSRVRQSRR